METSSGGNWDLIPIGRQMPFLSIIGWRNRRREPAMVSIVIQLVFSRLNAGSQVCFEAHGKHATIVKLYIFLLLSLNSLNNMWCCVGIVSVHNYMILKMCVFSQLAKEVTWTLVRLVCDGWCVRFGVWRWCVTDGVWRLVCETWCVRPGVWGLVCEIWFMRPVVWRLGFVTAWCVTADVWGLCLRPGVWGLVWRMVCDGWCVTAGVWRMVCDGWCVTAGVWRLVYNGSSHNSNQLTQ